MDNRRIKLGTDIANLLLQATNISNDLGLDVVTSLVAFVVLVTMKGNSLNKYLLRNNLREEEIANKLDELLKQHLNNVVKKEIKEEFVTIRYMSNKDMDETFKITRELYNTMLLANDIANKYYDTKNVTNEFLFSAFTETLTDIYLDFITMCCGKDAPLPNTALDKYYAPNIQNDIFTIPSNLSGFLTIMNNDNSANEKECRILGRDKETEQLIRILAKATKKNAILVGPPGVGKTAIVEKFTWSVTTGNCYEKFKNTKVIALDVTSIIASTKYRGEAEERFQELIDFLENTPQCILFIDEIHTILGAGACRNGELDLANALKPILARGDTRVIGATTSEEYENYFSKDGALKRRFEKIVVKEPCTDELYEMIKNQIKYLENYHHTSISKELVDFAILNASCFNYETKNPDRTLDLLDCSMAGAELRGKNYVDKADILENFSINQKKFEAMSEQEKKVIAYHEAGHYIVQHFSDKLQHYTTLAISIMPAEDYLGVNVYEKNPYAIFSTTKDAYIQLIARSLGGRIAEKIYTDEFSSGSSADLYNATKIAREVVTCYGLSNFTKNRTFCEKNGNIIYTEEQIEKINKEIDEVLNEAQKYANNLLHKHKEELESLAVKLTEKGILSKLEIEDILKRTQLIIADLVEF